MSHDLKIVTTVSNEAEAEMVCESLLEAGIRSMAQVSSDGIRLGAAASRDVYVDEQDYDRALEVLNAAVPSEEELARLSGEAGEGSAPSG
jgi:Putative prokaryotic signal transducing protein